MARQPRGKVAGEVSPSELLPPGLRGALSTASRIHASESSESPTATASQGGIDAETRHRMISEAAYRLYVQRGYLEGFELEDWLQAEAEVDGQLGNHSEE
jgi:hypothetical protein